MVHLVAGSCFWLQETSGNFHISTYSRELFTANTCAEGCLPFALGGRQTTEQPMSLMNRMNLGISPTGLKAFLLYSTGNYSVETKKSVLLEFRAVNPMKN